MRAYVSVGSNMAPEENIRAALRALEARYGPLAVSPVYRSAAVGFEGGDFLNLVVAFDTGEPPRAVARALRELEDARGRDRSAPRFSDRPLDLDLVLHGDAVVDEPDLQLPRGDVDEYAFVLWPLADLAPEGRDPRTGETWAQRRRRFPADAGQPLTRVAVDLAPAGEGA